MLRTALLLVILAPVLLEPVRAAATDPGFAPIAAETTAPICKPLAKVKAGFDSSFTLVALTPGQYLFIEGFYLGSPSTPEGLPPGNGALLIRHVGDKGGAIVWTRGQGQPELACITPIQVRQNVVQYMPLPVDEKTVAALIAVKTGVGETAPASKDDGEGDLHL